MLALPMRRVLLSLSVLVLAVPGVAAAAPRTPIPVSPLNGATTSFVPALGWQAVSGAHHYVYQLAADSGFNSPVSVSGASVLETYNTWATFKTAVPNGNYYWHVRAVDAAGKLSPWSSPRLFRKQWRSDTTVLSPGDGATITFPTNPTLTWAPVAGAAKYEFTLASDADLSSLDGQPAKGIETDASSYTVTSGLAAGSTYFWSVTPIDAAGNRGTAPTEPWRFTWKWNSTTALTFEDLAPAGDVVDPRFSWDQIPNAARYEVEINSDAGFAAGSKFCCTAPTVATTLTPTTVLLNNRYYWRVRGIDANGNFGVWNYWSNPVTHEAFFRKTFDTRDPGDLTPSISNLRMVDNLTDPGGDGTDVDPVADGYQTQVPIVTWDPVLGASGYEVDVRYFNGGGCSAADTSQYWPVTVGTNAWTPLGPSPSGGEPWPNHGRSLSHDGSRRLIVGNSYCVRVRAYTDKGYDQNHILRDVVGDWTYLDNGGDPSGNNAVSFEFMGYPDDTSCTDVQAPPTCSAAYPQDGDYLLPQSGSSPSQTPYFTWNPTPRAQGYFVLVSRDPNFTTVSDYAWVRGPAYAPRFGISSATTYADETTGYYWVVLPAAYPNGLNALVDPLFAHASFFDKESAPPAQVAPTGGSAVNLRPTFTWSLAHWARTYTLQVATDPLFSNLVETVETASSSYTPESSYPADQSLYWRVRSNDWNDIALTWSPAQAFLLARTAPVPSAANLAASELVPTWSWSLVQGAISYDVELQYPNGTKTLSRGFRTTAITPVKLDGTGIWHWKVRANFPTKVSSTTIQGPWSASVAFRNSMASPRNARTPSGGYGAVFAWDQKVGAAHYVVEVSTHQDFSGPAVERIQVDSPTYAPLAKNPAYANGGTLYWRVAAVDDSGNVGEMTKALGFRLPIALKVTATGFLVKGKSGKLTVSVRDAFGKALKRARVTITGAGLRKKIAYTKSTGRTSALSLRPKKRTKVTVTVSKSGYKTTTVSVTVR
jgi:hypothetical protein